MAITLLIGILDVDANGTASLNGYLREIMHEGSFEAIQARMRKVGGNRIQTHIQFKTKDNKYKYLVSDGSTLPATYLYLGS